TICYYDKATRKITKLPELPNVKKRDKFSPITGISIGKGEELVVIDKANSAFIFNHKENKWNEFLPEGFLTKALPADAIVNDIDIDIKNRMLWMTTETYGLIGINTVSKKIIHIDKGEKHGLQGNNQIGILPDAEKEHLLWISSSSGLVLFDKTTLKCRD